MTAVFTSILSLSLSGTLLMGMLLLVKPLFRRHFSQIWQYYIWLLVLARFLLPVSLPVNVIGSVISGMQPSYVTEPAVIREEGAVPAFRSEPAKTAEPSGQTPYTGDALPMEEEAFAEPSLPELSGWLYIAVAFLAFLFQIVPYFHFLLLLKKSCVPIADPGILSCFDRVKKEMKVKRNISLRQYEPLCSPILIGAFHPLLVINDAISDERELAYIFRHELLHYKRKDILYKLLVRIVRCLHWFNPLLWILEKEVGRSCELSIDESIIRSLSPEEKIAYGDTLLHSVKKMAEKKRRPAGIAFHRNAKSIKERLGVIMTYQKKSKKTIGCTALFSVLLLLGAGFLGFYQAEAKEASQTGESFKMEDALPSELPYQSLADSSDASADSNKDTYFYTQRSFYSDPYIIEMGWNIPLSKKGGKEFPVSKTLSIGKKNYTVFFSEKTKKYTKDETFLEMIKKIMNDLLTLQQKGENTELALKTPYIVNVYGPYSKSPAALASAFYKKGSISRFAAVFPFLSKTKQNDYLNKAYNDGHIALFSASIDRADKKIIDDFARKAYDDDKTNFFSVLCNRLDDKTIESYLKKAWKEEETGFFSVALGCIGDKKIIGDFARKAYDEDRTAFFAVLSGYLDEDTKKDFLKKAKKDKKTWVYYLLSEN